ncbi:hypothetical protein EZI54_20920 [Marinobacter halodurans]|uniref:Uncharacterized protein n=1 Tax=Marinobacter halodurans TaxID=2528979 RepID=A0ABY1ZIH5_9GAMM|nr:hypothetical protein [Marinobacter halodurans]TBW48751.1 hypothetical protein EZI54_20920 [Marinobacter halodurans]
MWPLNASNTGAETVKGPKLTAEHWYLDDQLADGRYKNLGKQALGTARNRVFLQPRYAKRPS